MTTKLFFYIVEYFVDQISKDQENNYAVAKALTRAIIFSINSLFLMSLHMFVQKLVVRYYEFKSATVAEFKGSKNFVKIFTYGSNITSVVLIIASVIMLYIVWLDIFSNEIKYHASPAFIIFLIIFGVLKFLFDIGMVTIFIKLIIFFQRQR